DWSSDVCSSDVLDPRRHPLSAHAAGVAARAVRTPGFQWFVAWRYLMARPRRLSGTILVFAAAFAGVLLAAGLAAGLQPLTDDYIAAGLPVPWWLPPGFGLLMALP